MNGVIIAAVLGIGALLFVGVVLSRQSSRQKKQAVASLEAERRAIGNHTILDLVVEEVDDLGLRDVEGAGDLGPDVLLRAWNDAPPDVRARDRSELRFTLREGVETSDPGPEDVLLLAATEPTPTVEDADPSPTDDEQEGTHD